MTKATASTDDVPFLVREIVDKAVKCEIVDMDDRHFGNFWVKHRDPSTFTYNSKLKRRYDAMKLEELRRINKPRTEDDQAARREFLCRFFVEEFVENSEIRSSADPSQYLPHSSDMVVRFLLHPKMTFAYDELLAQSADVANFRPDEDTKNA